MRITGSEVGEFNVPLSDAPLVVTTGNRTKHFPSRKGAYLILSAGELKGIGELVEPVFSLSPDSSAVLSAGITRLRVIAEAVVGQEIACSVDVNASITGVMLAVGSCNETHADVLARFALEQALLRLFAKHEGIPLSLVLRQWIWPDALGPLTSVVRINLLFNCRNSNHQTTIPPSGCVKLKVGRSPTEDADLVNKLVNDNPGQSKNSAWLRLDANQAWSVEEATVFAKQLSVNSLNAIEYIEEPIRDPCVVEIRELRVLEPKWNSIRIALDESVLLPSARTLLSDDSSLQMVHKSFLHGTDLLRDFSDRTTLTCTFETGVGLSFLLCLACARDSVHPSQIAFHGIHALSAMVESDETTRRIDSFFQTDESGIRVEMNRVHAFEQTLL